MGHKVTLEDQGIEREEAVQETETKEQVYVSLDALAEECEAEIEDASDDDVVISIRREGDFFVGQFMIPVSRMRNMRQTEKTLQVARGGTSEPLGFLIEDSDLGNGRLRNVKMKVGVSLYILRRDVEKALGRKR